MMDDEPDEIIIEFVELRENMFAYRKIDKKLKDKRCKGSEKCLVTECLTFNDYKTCLLEGETIY